ncbi:Putative uncharacterized protein [Moritella viscosa]|uniref:trypsin-like serine peptidase n=1 Tax=Moritella viscosa TaxID=80854 RepID=UPI000923F388|nr:trypsin-like serine protease [Moritella viscosa]SHO23829.1 Putative uncharacterized protein [Moritella viscosa]
MKTNILSLLSLSIISTFSASTYAVEGGTSLTWSEHPYLIESQCTGTVIAGKYVLLAGHCAASVDSPFPRQVNLSNGNDMMPTARNAKPYYNVDGSWGGGADVAIWTLPSTAPMDKVVFIAELNDAASTVNIGDNVSFMGFGQDDNTPRLGQAFNTVTIKYPEIIVYEDAVAHSVPGDSGAPVFNTDNKIIGVNYAGGGTIDPGTGRYDQSGVDLHFVKNWLLETIDRWHSATELKLTGTQTLDVQSLHVNDVDMASRWNDGSLTTGDVSVTGGTCVTDGVVAPFGMCTLEITSLGGEGKIALEEGNEITLNRVIKPTPKPTPQPDSGSSGGSFGFASILGLLALLWCRKC